MYKNIGEKIRAYAQFLGWLGAGIGIVIFLLCASLMRHAGFIVGLVVGGLLFLLMWIGSWVLYGFGVMVTESEHQTLLLQQTKTALEKLTGSSVPATPALNDPAKTEEVPKTERIPEAEVKVPEADISHIRPVQESGKYENGAVHFPTRPNGVYSEKYLICPLCNTKQESFRASCRICGVKFVFDDEQP